MTEKAYNVGIYCRLSNDDERDGESVSIENQRLLLTQYVHDRGWNLVDTYIDDGYSGTNFNRPGVQRLIADAEAKRINVIIVKDLSRFGRNVVQFGHYTEDVFPAVGCRFIAINNGIDTGGQNSNNEVMGFLNLFNEFYCRDTSKKVRAVRRACAESGKFVGSHAAFGYKRDPLNKHHLLIDEENAPLVRRIFAMRASGMGYRQIAVILNDESIPCPGEVFYQSRGEKDPRRVNHKWADMTVKTILHNEVYIGNMVQGRRSTVSYKCRKTVAKPKDEWIRVEGTHEPIISRDVWETVVNLDRNRVRKRGASEGKSSIFTGLVYCADCGFKMHVHTDSFHHKNGESGKRRYFICGNYSRSGKTACTHHTIKEDDIYHIVLDDIRAKAQLVAYDREAMLERIIQAKDKENHTRLVSSEQELRVTSARVRELENLMQNLYEDKCAGTIPQTVFQTLMKKYETERAQKADSIRDLEQRVRENRENRQDADHWADLIRRYAEIAELDETILFELVDRIEVGETEKRGKLRICKVKVCYRYVGTVDTDAGAEVSAV